jgi:serine/threonine-protein kinase
MPTEGAATFDADHWSELQTLFARCEHVPPSDRERELVAAGADLQLRRRVLALLRAADAVAQAADGAPEAKPPPHAYVGQYRLVRELGAGGIGAVYLAERCVDGVTLRSALKVLAPHAVDASFVERFHREQQHLAALDHPNITRLLDAGWSANGQPYLVMEYVDGVHFDDYCDRRGLPLVDRLRLFLKVCDAVSNAHRNLIVHLDLKPSNILVTDAGAVKLLDFGTSKLIRSDGNSTSTVMATPAYASPEQLLNLPVSTASDVYGLGAILFALLAGRPPFKNPSVAARTEAAVRETEPEPVFKAATAAAAAHRGLTEGRLRHALRGDLAAIVAACLRSQPRDRYTSVEALGEEIRRYLASQPVLVRRQTLRYTAMKFVRRHRVPVALGCAVLLTVAVSLAYAWSQQRHALREAERAVRMQTFLFSLFKMANPSYTGKPVASVPEFLGVGMAKLPDFIHDPSDLRAAELGLAESMFESGSYADARAAFAKIAAEARAAGALEDQAEAESYAAAVEFQAGKIPRGRALSADALKLATGPGVAPRVRVLAQIYYAFNEDNNGFRSDRNLELLRNAVRECRDRGLSLRETSLALSLLASDLVLRGLVVEAKPIFQQLLALYVPDPLAVCDRSGVYGWLAWIDDATGDLPSSLAQFRKAYDGYVACAGPDSRGALEELPYWADALIKSGRAAEALAMLEPALPTWRRIAGHADQSDMLYFLTRAYLATGRNTEAAAYATELLALLDGNLAPDSRDIGAAHMVLGEALAAQGRYREATPHAREAVRLLVASAVSDYGRQQGAEATDLLHRLSLAGDAHP